MKHILSPTMQRDLLTNVQEGDSQPNAVDLRVQDIFALKDETFILTDDKKTHRGSEKINVDENGMFCLEPGVYEIIHVAHGPAAIQRGSRVGQFLMFEAETLSMYDGDYGIGKSHDAKYGEKNGN